jgi:hypothetical protein
MDLRRKKKLFLGVIAFIAILGTVTTGGTPGCGDDDGASNQAREFISSEAQGHTHELVLTDEDLRMDSLSTQTSVVAGHLHTVDLNGPQLEAIRTGQEATAETSVDAGHSHTFSFQE